VEVLTAAVDDVHPDADAAVRDQDLALTRRRSVTITSLTAAIAGARTACKFKGR
jgi:hypothetical protein